jgi:5-methylcytosine-specific restriction endonuclease McrA
VSVTESTKAFVRQRAGFACEYCQRPQEESLWAALQIDHVIPKKHGGSDHEENFALACIDCNLHKGSNLIGIDPETNEITALFHPRSQAWGDHFFWDGLYFRGRTPIGRAAVRVFNMNSDDQPARRPL